MAWVSLCFISQVEATPFTKGQHLIDIAEFQHGTARAQQKALCRCPLQLRSRRSRGPGQVPIGTTGLFWRKICDDLWRFLGMGWLGEKAVLCKLKNEGHWNELQRSILFCSSSWFYLTKIWLGHTGPQHRNTATICNVLAKLRVDWSSARHQSYNSGLVCLNTFIHAHTQIVVKEKHQFFWVTKSKWLVTKFGSRLTSHQF